MKKTTTYSRSSLKLRLLDLHVFHLIVGLLLFFVGQKGQFCPCLSFCCCLAFVVCCFPCFPCCLLCLFVCYASCFHHGPSKTKNLHFHLTPSHKDEVPLKTTDSVRKSQKSRSEKLTPSRYLWGFGKFSPSRSLTLGLSSETKRGHFLVGWVGGSNGCFFLQRIDVYIYIHLYDVFLDSNRNCTYFLFK